MTQRNNPVVSIYDTAADFFVKSDGRRSPNEKTNLKSQPRPYLTGAKICKIPKITNFAKTAALSHEPE